MDIRGPDECWPWTACLSQGYGTFTFDYKVISAHRVVHELMKGPLGDLCACHHCDNPPCCNPAHIFAGTRGDNNRDRTAKGRTVNGQLKGAEHYNTRLTESQVLEIRARWAAGERRIALGKEFGIAPGHVASIAYRRCWKHL